MSHNVLKNILKKIKSALSFGMYFMNNRLQPEREMKVPRASLAVLSEVFVMLSLYRDLRL